jgi:hypothetical protein
MPVQVRLCTPGSAVSLGGGQHRLVAASPGLFTMTDVTLQSPAAGTTAAAPARTLKVLGWQPDSRAVSIGPGAASYLEVHQNANPGWTATLNGRSLASTRLDGWQQAFIVPAGAGGVITMTFAPATLYHIGLALAVLAILGLLAVAFGWRRWPAYVFPLAYFIEVGWSVQLKAGRAAALWVPLELLAVLAVAVLALAIPRFRGARPPMPAVPGRAVALRRTQGSVASLAAASSARIRNRTARRSATVRRWLGPLAVGVFVLLVGGILVLAVPVLAVIASMRPRWLPVISLTAMLIAGFIAATAAAPAILGSGAFGFGAQAFALVALAAALMPRPAPGTAVHRDGWRPSRPLPALGGRSRLPAPEPTRSLGSSRSPLPAPAPEASLPLGTGGGH